MHKRTYDEERKRDQKGIAKNNEELCLDDRCKMWLNDSQGWKDQSFSLTSNGHFKFSKIKITVKFLNDSWKLKRKNEWKDWSSGYLKALQT